MEKDQKKQLKQKKYVHGTHTKQFIKMLEDKQKDKPRKIPVEMIFKIVNVNYARCVEKDCMYTKFAEGGCIAHFKAKLNKSEDPEAYDKCLAGLYQ